MGKWTTIYLPMRCVCIVLTSPQMVTTRYPERVRCSKLKIYQQSAIITKSHHSPIFHTGEIIRRWSCCATTGHVTRKGQKILSIYRGSNTHTANCHYCLYWAFFWPYDYINPPTNYKTCQVFNLHRLKLVKLTQHCTVLCLKCWCVGTCQ